MTAVKPIRPSILLSLSLVQPKLGEERQILSQLKSQIAISFLFP
jgi:hypothetical protein